MTMVLVHGGGMDGRCWDRLLPVLDDDDVRVVDLPGRGARPADLATVTVADFVAAVVEVLEADDAHDALLVGHSLAGITLPGVARAVPDRLRGLVFVSCAVPPSGSAVADVLASAGPVLADLMERLGDDLVSEDGRLHPELATALFCNDLDAEQTAFALSCLVPEAAPIIFEPVDVSLPPGLARTYVRLARDASITLEAQDAMIANLGGAEVVDLDAGHMAMISRPRALAAILAAC